MNSNFKITVELRRDKYDLSPETTEKYTFEEDTEPASITDIVETFRKILYCLGYSEELIEEVFNSEE